MSHKDVLPIRPQTVAAILYRANDQTSLTGDNTVRTVSMDTCTEGLAWFSAGGFSPSEAGAYFVIAKALWDQTTLGTQIETLIVVNGDAYNAPGSYDPVTEGGSMHAINCCLVPLKPGDVVKLGFRASGGTVTAKAGSTNTYLHVFKV